MEPQSPWQLGAVSGSGSWQCGIWITSVLLKMRQRVIQSIFLLMLFVWKICKDLL